MSKVTCEFCSSQFANKYILNTHQKTAKKCLSLQQKNPELQFVCNHCTKLFTTKKILKEHENNCLEKKIKTEKEQIHTEYLILKTQIENKEKENQELKKQVKELQEKLANIAEIGAKKDTKTTNTYRVNNNNIVNNLVPYDLDKDKILTIVDEKFNENYLYARENGIANFAVNNLLKDNEGNLKLTCTDTARKIFVYKDTNGNFYKDPNANGFLENYMPAVKKKSYEIISDKDGEEMVELTDCVTSIEPINISNKLAGKLLAKPKK